MALYMVHFAYTAEALATLAQNPQDRSVPSRELIEKSGGDDRLLLLLWGVRWGRTL
jgi:hypothetical protein